MFERVFFFTLLVNAHSSQGSIDTSDYDAYGLKLAGNDLLLVEALNDAHMFLLGFAPFNVTLHSRQCSVNYNHSSHYVYSVGIGHKQTSNQTYFFYAGESLERSSPSTNRATNSQMFIGILIKKSPSLDPNSSTTVHCDDFEHHSLEFISSYDHQEYFVFSVEPYGQYAVGLTKDFLFVYRPFSSSWLTMKKSEQVWPSNTTFIPVAVDTDTSYTIVAGFILHGPLFRIRATPTAYVLSNSDLTVLSTWSYTAVLNSWQSNLTYSSLKTWSSRYVMSVKIDPNDSSRVLIGMPFLNIVFFLRVTSHGKKITLHSYVDHGGSTGFGKSVAWLADGRSAILHSSPLNSESSSVSFYESSGNGAFPSAPSMIFPNIQQTLPMIVNHRFIRMLSTPTSVLVLTIGGETLIISPARPGYFASTSLSTSESLFFESQSVICMAGTYKNDTSIWPCSLCPSGTRNNGSLPVKSCPSCSPEMFCPLGSVTEINRNCLLARSQAYVHPRSPEVTVFDEILLQNMFSAASGDNCLLISPLFWVGIVVTGVFIFVLLMAILKRYVKHPRSAQLRSHVKTIFRQTDLIHEGEMWIGGLVSFAVVIFFIFAYIFSAAFYREYPMDDTPPWTFSCGKTVRNVKYESGLQSLAIPASIEELPIFDLLNAQLFTLQLDLLNTVASCQALVLEQVFESSTNRMIFTCSESAGILSAVFQFTRQRMTLKWTLNDISLIGALRISLTAVGKLHEQYKLKELDFRQTIVDEFNRTMAQSVTINLQLTKAINETEPLAGHEPKYSALWYPTLTVNDNEIFLSSQAYATLTDRQGSTHLTMVIDESSYYIKNRQLPIAKLREIIFHNLLFTIVCLEIFRLNVLLCKLVVVPFIRFLLRHFYKTKQLPDTLMKTIDHQSTSDEHPTDADSNSVVAGVDEEATSTKDHDVIRVQ